MRTNAFGIATANIAPPAEARRVDIPDQTEVAPQRSRFLSRSNVLCSIMTLLLVGTGVGISTYYVLVEM